MFIRDPIIHLKMVLTGRTDIYLIVWFSTNLQMFKYNPFKAIFSMKNETILELFNFHGTINYISCNLKIFKIVQTNACKYM